MHVTISGTHSMLGVLGDHGACNHQRHTHTACWVYWETVHVTISGTHTQHHPANTTAMHTSGCVAMTAATLNALCLQVVIIAVSTVHAIPLRSRRLSDPDESGTSVGDCTRPPIPLTNLLLVHA